MTEETSVEYRVNSSNFGPDILPSEKDAEEMHTCGGNEKIQPAARLTPRREIY